MQFQPFYYDEMLSALKFLRDEGKFESIKMLNSHNYKALPSSMFKVTNGNSDNCVSANDKLTVHEEVVLNFVRVFTSQAMLQYFEVLTGNYFQSKVFLIKLKLNNQT